MIFCVEATITLCWPHIKRNAIPKDASKMTSHEFMTVAQEDITHLHFTRSVQQFDAMSTMMICSWEQRGQHAFAAWLQKEYLTPPFNRWSVTASGIPGCNGNNNPVESYHRNEKRTFGTLKGGRLFHDNPDLTLFL